MAKRDKNGRFVKESAFKKNRNEIFYHLINSLLAGGLVFLGTISDGKISKGEILASSATAIGVALIKFKEYWVSEKKEYAHKIFNFI